MGLLDFFKKKENVLEKTEKSVLLAMPMFNDSERYTINNVIENLKDF